MCELPPNPAICRGALRARRISVPVFKPGARHRGVHLALPDQLREDVRCVLMVRDPRDVVCSWRAFSARMPEAWRTIVQRAPIETWAQLWNDVPAIVQAKSPGHLTVRYEDLVDDLAGQVRRVCDFLGIRFRSNTLTSTANRDHLHQLQRRHGTPTDAAVGFWRAAMSRKDAEHVGAACGGLMRLYGYDA